MDSYCHALAGCLTPCEFDVMARQQLKAGEGIGGVFPHEVVARKMFLAKQETWVCRYHDMGTVGSLSGAAESPSQMWIAALYVALIQVSAWMHACSLPLPPASRPYSSHCLRLSSHAPSSSSEAASDPSSPRTGSSTASSSSPSS